jgi:hypothetical protein
MGVSFPSVKKYLPKKKTGPEWRSKGETTLVFCLQLLTSQEEFLTTVTAWGILKSLPTAESAV